MRAFSMARTLARRSESFACSVFRGALHRREHQHGAARRPGARKLARGLGEQAPDGRLGRRLLVEPLRHRLDAPLVVAPERLEVKLLLVAEGRVQAGRVDAHGAREVAHRGRLVTLPPEHVHRALEGAAAVERARPAARLVGVHALHITCVAVVTECGRSPWMARPTVPRISKDRYRKDSFNELSSIRRTPQRARSRGGGGCCRRRSRCIRAALDGCREQGCRLGAAAGDAGSRAGDPAAGSRPGTSSPGVSKRSSASTCARASPARSSRCTSSRARS